MVHAPWVLCRIRRAAHADFRGRRVRRHLRIPCRLNNAIGNRVHLCGVHTTAPYPVLNKLLQVLLLVAAGSLASAACAQEVCNNALDDDGDGLIDLNDTLDCVCTPITGGGDVESIIPNPSFEVCDCVPTGPSEMSCADTWEQATEATSDFLLNINGGLWFPNTPQPLPDGIGITGFFALDSLDDSGSFYPYAEYLGACLLSPMQAGVQYTLQMALAGGPSVVFNDVNTTFPIVAPYGPLEITIFGSASCPTFPVSVPPYTCPEGVGDWTVLGASSYTSNGLWQTLTITFTPAVDIQAVMIGPPCTIPDDYNYYVGVTPISPYFFADDLVLNQSALFGATVTQSGGFCANDLVLHGNPDGPASSYQWYLDGVALVGETDSVLEVSGLGLSSGLYQFRATLQDTACVVSALLLEAPDIPLALIGAAPTRGCAPLVVAFTNNTDAALTAAQAWDFGTGGATSTAAGPVFTYTQPGLYDVNLQVTSPDGCVRDTTYVGLVEVFGPPVAGFTFGPQPTDIFGTSITFTDNSSPNVTGWTWTFGEGGILGTSQEADPVLQFPVDAAGAYPVELVVTTEDGCTDTARAVVEIGGYYAVHVPNAFTPDGDGINEVFRPVIRDQDVRRYRFAIFDRWGREVWSSIDPGDGWDGTLGGEVVQAGLYAWKLETRDLLLGIGQVYFGHVSLLR